MEKPQKKLQKLLKFFLYINIFQQRNQNKTKIMHGVFRKYVVMTKRGIYIYLYIFIKY